MGVPYIKNYHKSVYRSGNQNWAIAQDKSGIMYYANSEGLLTYDGRHWQKYAMPHRQILRSVATDNNGRIYTGSFGEFGFWSFKNHRLKFTSLTHLIPFKNTLRSEIWKIYVDDKRVIFQSFSTIYLYQDNKIEAIQSDSPCLFLHHLGKRFFIEVLEKGLFELVNKTLVLIPGSEHIHGILSILPYKTGQCIIGTSANGLFIYNGATFIPLNTPASAFLKEHQLNNGAMVLGKYYAYGTILNGLIIINQEGRIIQRINKNNGLQNNTVLNLYADNNQNLWAGLDNGIDRIELNSPLYFNFDKTGKLGTVYSSIINNGKIYLGTNHGLFYSNWSWDNNELNFKMIPNSKGQVWDLSLIDGQLLCGHTNGTFIVVGDHMKKISSLNGGWTIKRLKSAPNMLIQGTYNGLALYERAPDGQWKLSARIADFAAPSRHLEQDNKGDIWVSHAYQGLNKLTLSRDFKTVIAKKDYNEKDGLPDTYNINVFNLNDKIICSSDSGFYIYDDLSNRFSKYEVLNKKLGSFAASNRIIKAGPNLYWFIHHGKIALVDFSQTGKLKISSSPFDILEGRMVQHYENISRISDSIFLISIDDGFVIYDTTQNNFNHPSKALPAVLIREIGDITGKYQIISENGSTFGSLLIPFSRNNIRIKYSLPYYVKASIKFQYYLDGYSNEWSDWNTATQKDFTNLPSGTYQFKVRAKINNIAATQITILKFDVQPPWYNCKWAWFLYIILIGIILYVGKISYQRKLKIDHKKILFDVQKEHEEYLHLEAEANEQRMAKLQTEKLQAELESKKRELNSSVASLAYKNDLLKKLSEEFPRIKDSTGNKLPVDQINKLQKVINEVMNDEHDWNLFENVLNEAHESFFKKLRERHPDLIPNDLELCAYLRMSMSSKEISSLIKISPRGVELRRYRLRKKLGLSQDKNLAKYLTEL